MLAAIPLLGFALILANVFAFVGATGFDTVWVQFVLPSDATVNMTTGWSITLLALVLLYIEIFKATRTGNASIIDHALSLLVFVIALVEFLIWPAFAHPSFLVLLVMTLIDVIAGFTVTISSARRDWGMPQQGG